MAEYLYGGAAPRFGATSYTPPALYPWQDRDTPHDAHATIAHASGVTDARRAAAEVCADLRRGELLDASFDRRTALLDARDRRWTRELTYGMLRARGRLDALLAGRVRGGISSPGLQELLDLLRLGAYQLLEMGSVPAYAAIAQTVELAKQRAGEERASSRTLVLRRLDRERDALALPANAESIADTGDRVFPPTVVGCAVGGSLGNGGNATSCAGAEQHGRADHRASLSCGTRAARSGA